MDREILFRGMKIVSGEWVEGDLFQHGEQKFIMGNNRNTEVIPSTVGQYTGLTDKNGVKIFEGDILIFVDPDTSEYDKNERYLVQWDKETAGFLTEYFWCKKSCGLDELLRLYSVNYEVIGNIHDNPELIGGDNNA